MHELHPNHSNFYLKKFHQEKKLVNLWRLGLRTLKNYLVSNKLFI